MNIFFFTEKEELITLVVAYANTSNITPPTSNLSSGVGTSPTNTENNPFEQIRQTCTTLFTNLTEKIATDLQKTTFPYGYAQPAPAPPPPQTSATTSRVPVSPPNHVESQSNDPITVPPGPSAPVNMSTSSSFEEIGAVGGQSPDDWQFVTTTKTKESEKLDKMKHSIDQIDKLLGARSKHPNKRINRRRSDSDVRSFVDDIRDCMFEEEVKRVRKSCGKCNEAGEKIRARISEFRQQLELPSVTEDQNREILDEFLRYLETSSKVSVPHTPEEMEICEEIRSSVTGATQTDTLIDENPQPSSSSDPVQSPLERIPFDPNQRVDLTDINSRADFDLLTVKQLKEILALNRVDFKGCCEKNELKERVIRLWTNHTALPKPDDLPTDDLCKICMDAPIECVLLECGHLVACVKCSKVLSECPICRAYIVRIVRFFRV